MITRQICNNISPKFLLKILISEAPTRSQFTDFNRKMNLNSYQYSIAVHLFRKELKFMFQQHHQSRTNFRSITTISNNNITTLHAHQVERERERGVPWEGRENIYETILVHYSHSPFAERQWYQVLRLRSCHYSRSPFLMREWTKTEETNITNHILLMAVFSVLTNHIFSFNL